MSGEDALSPEPRNLGRRWLGTEVQERTGCAGATRGWDVPKLRRADVARVEGRGPGAGPEEGQALNRQEGEVGKSCQNSSSCLGVVEQVGVTPAKGASIDARKMLILSVHFATHSSRSPRLGLFFFFFLRQLPSLVTCLPSFSLTFDSGSATQMTCVKTFSSPYIMPLAMQSF